MRWLVLASSVTSTNGYGSMCGAIARALKGFAGVEADVFTGDEPSLLSGRRGLLCERIASYPRLWFAFAGIDTLKLLALARGRYDGVLVLVEHYAVAGWAFAALKGLPLMLVQNGTYAVKLPHDVPFFKSVLERADSVLPISAYTRKRMEEEGIACRYRVVPLGVDSAAFRPSGPRPRERCIVFVGNLKARKGLDFLLEAMALAVREVPDIRLRVIGKIDPASPAFAAVERRIGRDGLRVEFTGPLSHEDLVEAYATARLNVLPSKSERFFFEGFGLIHLEANSCGTLTVGTLDSGNEEAVLPGLGTLVRYGDAEALARAIVDAMRIEPYPRLPVERVRTWRDVALEYRDAMAEAAAKRASRGAAVRPAAGKAEAAGV